MESKINIVRSKRKSICLTVSAENEITVRCPVGMPEREIDYFVESKREWLDKVLLKNSVKLSENKDITDYNSIYVHGERLPLYISNKNQITDYAVYVKSFGHIKSTFIAYFSNSFAKNVEAISKSIKLPYGKLSIRYYKRRWGCCDRKGNLTFNYILFMLPSELQRYVIIHELCHTVYFNHSPAFWRLVQEFLPDYKILVKQLKSFDFITNLY